ncbi:MAG: ATP-grasp domain-containing protein [Patescibacteria group bacterium]
MFKPLYDYLAIHPVVYVTRDRERAEGLPSETEGYRIVSDQNKSTRELMQSLEIKPGESVLVFKPNRQVEEVCRAHNWPLLNPSASLAEKVEGKVSQVAWLGPLASLLPEHWEGQVSDCRWATPFVLQYNWGHSGEGTKLIKDEKDLGEIIKQFPYRKVRVSKLINGDTFTNNNIVTSSGNVMTGNISYQITGDSALTDNPFATVGNDWSLAETMLTEAEKGEYKKIVKKIGEKLASDGWKGLFGVDIIREKSTGKMYLIEVNARQPASTTFESQLQNEQRRPGLREDQVFVFVGITTFEAHISALVGLDLSKEKLIEIKHGRRTINRRENN